MQKKKPTNSDNNLALAGAIILSCISGFFTYNLTHSFLAEKLEPALAHTIAGSLAATIQILILVAENKLFQANGFMVRVVAIALMLSAYSISGLTGYGTWWQYFAKDAYAEEDFVAKSGTIVTALLIYSSRYEDAAIKLDSLSRHSISMESKERTLGGTCDSNIKGEGPRRRLRENESRDFQNFAGHFQMQNTRLRAIAKNVRDINFDITEVHSQARVLREAIQDFTVVATDPQIEKLREYLTLHTGERVFEAHNGKKFKCSDRRINTLGASVATSIEQLPEIPKWEGIFTGEGTQSIEKVYDDIFSGRTSLSEIHKPAAGLTIGVDLMIFLLMALRKSERPRQDNDIFLDDDEFGDDDRIETIQKLVIEGTHLPLFQLMKYFLLENRRGTWLVIPHNLPDEELNKIYTLVELLKSKGAAKLKVNSQKIDNLPSWWRESRSAIVGNSKTATVYKIPANLQSKIFMRSFKVAEKRMNEQVSEPA